MSAIDEVMKWDASTCDTAWDRNMVRAFQGLAERVQLLEEFNKHVEARIVERIVGEKPVQKAGDEELFTGREKVDQENHRAREDKLIAQYAGQIWIWYHCSSSNDADLRCILRDLIKAARQG